MNSRTIIPRGDNADNDASCHELTRTHFKTSFEARSSEKLLGKAGGEKGSMSAGDGFRMDDAGVFAGAFCGRD
jgi:hypothetical protein